MKMSLSNNIISNWKTWHNCETYKWLLLTYSILCYGLIAFIKYWQNITYHYVTELSSSPCPHKIMQGTATDISVQADLHDLLIERHANIQLKLYNMTTKSFYWPAHTICFCSKMSTWLSRTGCFECNFNQTNSDAIQKKRPITAPYLCVIDICVESKSNFYLPQMTGNFCK